MMGWNFVTAFLGAFFCVGCWAQPNENPISMDIVEALEATPGCKTANNGAIWKASVVLGLCGRKFCSLPDHFCSIAPNQRHLECSKVEPQCQSVISNVLIGKRAEPLDSAVNEPVAVKELANCADSNKFCCFWAFYGECDKNSAFMKTKCPKSCGTCQCNESNKTLCNTKLNVDNCQWISTAAERLSNLRRSGYGQPSTSITETMSTGSNECVPSADNPCNYWPIPESPSYPILPPAPPPPPYTPESTLPAGPNMLPTHSGQQVSQSQSSQTFQPKPSPQISYGPTQGLLGQNEGTAASVEMVIPAPPSIDSTNKCGTQGSSCGVPEFLKPQGGAPSSIDCQMGTSICGPTFGQSSIHTDLSACPSGQMLSGGSCVPSYGGSPIQRPYPQPQPMQPTYTQPMPQPMQPAPEPIQRPYPQPAPEPVQRPYPQPAPQPVQRPYPQPAPQPVQRPYPQPAPQPVQRPYPQPAPQPVQGPYPQPAPQPVQRPYPQPAPQPVQRPYPQPVQRPYPQPAPQPVQRPYPQPAPQVAQPYLSALPQPRPKPAPVPYMSSAPQPSVMRPYPMPAPGPVVSETLSEPVPQTMSSSGIINCIPDSIGSSQRQNGMPGGQMQPAPGSSSGGLTNCVPPDMNVASSVGSGYGPIASVKPSEFVSSYGKRKQAQMKLTFNRGRLVYQKQ